MKISKQAVLAVASLCLAGTILAQTTVPGQLIVKPDTLFFRQTGTAAPPSQAFSVTGLKGNPGVLTVTTSGGAWLSASLTGAAVHVSVNTTGLASGPYKGAVAIAATGFASTSVNVALTISGDNVIVSPATLNLSASVGGENNPRQQDIEIYNQNGSAFTWTAAADQPWLVISPVSGTGKVDLKVGLDPTKLTIAGTLTGHVTVTETGNASKATVTVTTTVAAAKPPNFQMGPYLNQPGVLNFVTESNLAAPAPQSFYGRNLGGGGSMSFTLTGSVTSPAGGNWLSFTPASGTTPGRVIVTVNPAGLSAGSYRATISGVAKTPAGSTAGTASLTDQVQVYLTVLAGPVTRLDRKFLRFATSQATPPVPSPASQTVALVTNSKTGYPYTATATTAKGGGWLSVAPASGTAANGSTVTVTVSAAVIGGLAPGFYTGQVQLSFTGGSPTAKRTIGIGLRVYGAADTPRLVLSPGGISFVAPAGGANPAAKSMNVRAEGGPATGIAFTVSSAVSTPVGGKWLSVGAASGTATTTAVPVSVSANTAGLGAGIYTGTVTFTPTAASNAAVLVANVNLIVGPVGSTPTGHLVSRADGSIQPLATPGVLAPGPLFATITDPPDNFTGSTDSAFNIGVSLVDSAGNAVPGAQVTVSSSNGEPDLSLDDLGSGAYSGLFQPASSGTVTLTIAAQATDSAGNFGQTGDGILISGDVESAGDVATPVYTSGAVGSASYSPQPTPITPGGLVTVFGTNIAGSGGMATTVPLPATLGGASVTIGGISAPLLGAFPATAPGGLDQINLQVPIELGSQSDADLVVTSNGVVGAPQTMPVGLAPAFFTQNSFGTGDGAFVHTDGVTLITPANPAAAGEVVVLYATGLGDVQTPVSNGTGAVAANSVTGSVRVTIGGTPATIQYAGLAPTSVGEYQINVVVPGGLPAGENNIIVFLNGSPATGRATIALR